jgi:hypothetical protein
LLLLLLALHNILISLTSGNVIARLLAHSRCRPAVKILCPWCLFRSSRLGKDGTLECSSWLELVGSVTVPGSS